MSFTCSQTFPFWAMWYYIVHSKCVLNIRTNIEREAENAKAKERFRSLSFCFFTFYSSKYLLVYQMCLNSHIQLSIYLSALLSKQQQKQRAYTHKAAHTPHSQQKQITKKCKGKSNIHMIDTYFACCQITFVCCTSWFT